jgi:hypothetical protein
MTNTVRSLLDAANPVSPVVTGGASWLTAAWDDGTIYRLMIERTPIVDLLSRATTQFDGGRALTVNFEQLGSILLKSMLPPASRLQRLLRRGLRPPQGYGHFASTGAGSLASSS